MKIKRHNKYRGKPRRRCNSLLAVFIFVMTIFDLGSALYNYFSCSTSVSNTAISAHVGGLVSGLCVAYVVMNKYKESWGQEKMRKNEKYTETNENDIRYGNCYNFKNAYLCNPDFIKILKGTQHYRHYKYKYM